MSTTATPKKPMIEMSDEELDNVINSAIDERRRVDELAAAGERAREERQAGIKWTSRPRSISTATKKPATS